MKRARSIPLIVAAVAVSLAMLGCSVTGPSVRILRGPAATRTPRVIERVVTVEVPAPAERSEQDQPKAEQVQPAATARPVATTADIATPIARGNYDIRIESETKTKELRDLLSAVNHLASNLSEQERLRKRLTSDVAHELRTPLTAVNVYLEAMIEGVWEATPERLKGCHEEIERLVSLVADLEQLVKVEGENLRLSKSRVDFMEIARAVGANLEAEARRKGMSIGISGEECVVEADRNRITQVLANLVSNAIKYTPNGGHIQVEVKDGGQSGTIRVKDDGIGIPERDIPLIFERFYRTDTSRSRKTGGAGIGLTIAQSIVKAHGGTIAVESRVNEGSCFTVTIPK